MNLLCAAMLPPSFIEYALRNGADGVLITGCREGDCEFRFGDRWTLQRISGERKPQLRKQVNRNRLHVAWAGPWDQQRLSRQLDQFRAALRKLADPQASSPRHTQSEVTHG